MERNVRPKIAHTANHRKHTGLGRLVVDDRVLRLAGANPSRAAARKNTRYASTFRSQAIRISHP